MHQPKSRLQRSCWRPIGVLLATLAAYPVTSVAGGPKYIAGTSYFDPAVLGQPVHWSAGLVHYYVDQGPLSAFVNNQQATAMVDQAAALWSAVPTAGITLIDAGTLNEDVSGANVLAGNPTATANATLAQPADVTPTATSFPIAIIYDAEGSVIESLFGAGASDPSACQNNAVWSWIDNIGTDATIAHAVILLNGLCSSTAAQTQMMSFLLERAFGRVLGLDFSQVNPGAFTSGDPNQELGTPIMQPLSGACGPAGGLCLPQPGVLRFDDIAALNRLYPISSANLASFAGKELTAPHTVSIQGTLSFRQGTGMQGVNVVARPLDANGNPLDQYTVAAVSGASFCGKHGNPVTGWNDANGNALTQWGSNDPLLQGFFDLSYMPLPPGMNAASYQVTFEPINPLYILGNSVGPYIDGSPAPSGTMPVLSVANLAAGALQTVPLTIDDSALDGYQDAIGTESEPRQLPPSGQWTGRISQIDQTDWFVFLIRAGRTFSLVTQALNENGLPSEGKAMPALGVWDAEAAAGTAAAAWAPGLNGYAAGESFLSIYAASDDLVRLGISDMRGDGRPDYAYIGWVLYADSVTPAHVPLGGGPIMIRGMGFRPSDTVKVNGKAATVTSVSPNEITAVVPPSTVSGSVDVEVDDLPLFSAESIVSGGLSYDAGTGDSLTLVSAPSNTVPIGVPLPFTVVALTSALTPAGGVTVSYAIAGGTASLGCGQTTCIVTASGDGLATMTVTAANASTAVVTASLANGASLQAHFTGGPAPVLTALTPSLSVAARAVVNWNVQALVLNNGAPMSGQTVAWQTTPGTGITVQGINTVNSGGNGVASATLIIGPLAEGQQSTATACVNGTSNCATFTVTGARPEFSSLEGVSGTAQTVAATSLPGLIVLRLRDMDGNPMAGGSVSFYQALYAWSPPCPPHGRCASTPLLTSEVSTAVSDVSGLVTFNPVSLPGVPTNLTGLAAAGNSSTVGIAVERHP